MGFSLCLPERAPSTTAPRLGCSPGPVRGKAQVQCPQAQALEKVWERLVCDIWTLANIFPLVPSWLYWD